MLSHFPHHLALAVAVAVLIAALAPAALAGGGGGGSGVQVGGMPAGFYLNVQNTTSSGGSAAGSAPAAGSPVISAGQGAGTVQQGPAPAAAAPAQAAGVPQDCGVQLSYCPASGINEGAAQVSSPAAPAARGSSPGHRIVISPAELALRVSRELILPVPVVDTAPPRGSDGWVGLPEYFWLAPGQWAPRTVRAQAGAEWAQITAVPVQMTLTPGTGLAPFTCDGPGVPYEQAGSRDACTYPYQQSSLFQPGGAYTVTVAVTWTGTWQGAGGAGGALPAVTRTTTFALPVAEGQALVDEG